MQSATKKSKVFWLFMMIGIVLNGTGVSAKDIFVSQPSIKSLTQAPIDYTPIYNVNDLYKVNVDPNGKYMLMNDIDLSETNGGSLDSGNGWVPLDKFTGVFDGNGHRIKNMSMHGTVDYDDIGLFSCIEDNARIENLGVANVNIDIKCTGEYPSIGGIVGAGGKWNDGINGMCEINNCYVTGKIRVSESEMSPDIGGIMGWNYLSKITNCYTDVNLAYEDGKTDVGGIVGLLRDYGICKNCYAIGKNNDGKMICGEFAYLDVLPENCYYLTNSGTDEYAMSLTSTEMKMTGAFPYFDFQNIWILDANSPYPYPQLRSCMQVRPTSIKLSSLPIKRTYQVDERLDLTGGALDVVYEDGNTANIPLDEHIVSCNMSTGTQTVTVTYGDHTESFEITIEKKNPNLKVKSKYQKIVGDRFYLKANRTGGGDITFASQDSGIAKVNADGMVEVLRAGTVTILVTVQDTYYYKSETKKVTLNVVSPTLIIPKTKITMSVGKKYSIGAKKTGSGKIAYNTSNKKVASVNKGGIIVAKNKGKAVITATLTTRHYKKIARKIIVNIKK